MKSIWGTIIQSKINSNQSCAKLGLKLLNTVKN